ncbi:hypothetical protein ADEAN_000925200 [Angomonas deanei]|uniref:Uncharacterized protein n=1 Tax=Angomonas deanei TaxID=59799 RepID=A0A7G2CRE0_9TRYP|nr:hypothetical protein ADEAN_000925200 [Angomonas deanei]
MHKLIIENQRLQILLEKEKKKPVPVYLGNAPPQHHKVSEEAVSSPFHSLNLTKDVVSPMRSGDYDDTTLPQNNNMNHNNISPVKGNDNNDTLPMREQSKRSASPYQRTRVPPGEQDSNNHNHANTHSSSTLPTPSLDRSSSDHNNHHHHNESEGSSHPSKRPQDSPSPSHGRSLPTPSSSSGSPPTYAQGASPYSGSSLPASQEQGYYFPPRQSASSNTTTNQPPPHHRHLENSSSLALTSTSSSVPYLYQLPRNPAEALREEVKLLTALKKLTQEKLELENRVRLMERLSEKDISQREMRLLSFSQENEKLRREGLHWQDRAHTAESHVLVLQDQLLDYKSKFEELQVELEHTRERMSSTQEEAHFIASLSSQALHKRHTEELAKLKEDHTAAEEMWNNSYQLLQQEMENNRNKYESEISGLTAAQTELEASYHTLQRAHDTIKNETEVEKRENTLNINYLHDKISRQKEIIEKLCKERNQLQEAAEHLSSQLHLHDNPHNNPNNAEMEWENMQTRYNEALEKIERLTLERDALHVRCTAAEEDGEQQENYYKQELKTLSQTIFCLQEEHRKQSEKQMKLYDKLRIKYESVKLKLTTVLKKDTYHYGNNNNENKNKETESHPILNHSEASNISENQTNNNNNNENENNNNNYQLDALQVLKQSTEILSRLSHSINK